MGKETNDLSESFDTCPTCDGEGCSMCGDEGGWPKGQTPKWALNASLTQPKEN